jgi:hypothetical protein
MVWWVYKCWTCLKEYEKDNILGLSTVYAFLKVLFVINLPSCVQKFFFPSNYLQLYSFVFYVSYSLCVCYRHVTDFTKSSISDTQQSYWNDGLFSILSGVIINFILAIWNVEVLACISSAVSLVWFDYFYEYFKPL